MQRQLSEEVQLLLFEISPIEKKRNLEIESHLLNITSYLNDLDDEKSTSNLTKERRW